MCEPTDFLHVLSNSEGKYFLIPTTKFRIISGKNRNVALSRQIFALNRHKLLQSRLLRVCICLRSRLNRDKLEFKPTASCTDS